MVYIFLEISSRRGSVMDYLGTAWGCSMNADAWRLLQYLP